MNKNSLLGLLFSNVSFLIEAIDDIESGKHVFFKQQLKRSAKELRKELLKIEKASYKLGDKQKEFFNEQVCNFNFWDHFNKNLVKNIDKLPEVCEILGMDVEFKD